MPQTTLPRPDLPRPPIGDRFGFRLVRALDSLVALFARRLNEIYSDTWTPTLTDGANVDSTTANVSYYFRVQDHVFCWGSLTVDPTADGGASTVVGISLPLAVDLSAATDLAGIAATGLGQRAGAITADTSNDRATLTFNSQRTDATDFNFTFAYRIPA